MKTDRVLSKLNVVLGRLLYSREGKEAVKPAASKLPPPKPIVRPAAAGGGKTAPPAAAKKPPPPTGSRVKGGYWVRVFDVGNSEHSLFQTAELGTFGILEFFTNKNFFCIFYQVSNLFLHQSYLKSPLPVKLTW